MKKKYEVSKTAGEFVAGMRSPGVGQTIELTESQAEHPLLLGEIVELEVAAKSADTKPKKD